MRQDARNEGIIYCRVSSKKQVAEGNGLESQETICREYIDRAGIKVLGVFSDDLTGKTAQRGGFKEAIAFLRKCRPGTQVVIDDLNRLARNREIRKLVDRLIETESPTLITAYEQRLNESEARKVELSEMVANCGRPSASFDDAFRTAMAFLASPSRI